jgi:hypothetical protein
MADESKTPSLFRNILSLIGLIIAVVALANIIFFAAIEIRGESTNQYAGILAYMIIPAFLILGLILFFSGALLERRRRHRAAPDEVPRMPILNLNDRRHRILTFAFVVGGAIFAMVSTVGAYEAYHYSDSVKFCGTTCHDLMIPEYTAYLNSPHARVPCVDCHVGPGATWFVRYKFDGMYQVYATLFEKYPKPIPTPVSNLRPAQDTCEQCHWPAKFWGSQLKTFNHFMYDEQNTPRETQMLLKVGGGQAGGEGIHWHMNIANEITYVAADRQRQVIPWVRMRNRNTGEVTEYTLADTEMTPQQIAAAEKRVMDCVECHSRPSHIYAPPDQAVDQALLMRKIDPSIPWIKQQAVLALSKDYPTTEAAVAGIGRDLAQFYQTNHADVYQARRPAVDAAIAATQEIFKTNMFPEMKVNWKTHFNNVGHLYYAGCFRCHDDNHVSKDGKKIRKDCDVCHEVVEQKLAGNAMTEMTSSPFVHPVELGDMTMFSCVDCHTGEAMEQ